MKVLIILSAVVAVSMAGYLPGGLAGITSYAAPAIAPVNYHAAVAPAVISSQHHAQDTLGQYNYGYTDGLSAKGEVKTADGVTRGGYSYLDSYGKVQNVAYTADAAGFRVAASNLPVAPAVPETPALEAPKPVEDTVEVADAKVAHQTAFNEAKIRAAAVPAPVAAPAVIAERGVIAAPAVSYSSISAPAVSYSSIAAPAVSYSSIAAPSRAFAYSSVAAAPAFGYSSIAAPAFGYSSIAAPAFGYSSIAAPAFGYSSIAAPAVTYSNIAAPAVSYSSIAAPAAPVVLTPQGVPVDTPEVQAARAADQAAHLRAKGLIY